MIGSLVLSNLPSFEDFAVVREWSRHQRIHRLDGRFMVTAFALRVAIRTTCLYNNVLVNGINASINGQNVR